MAKTYSFLTIAVALVLIETGCKTSICNENDDLKWSSFIDLGSVIFFGNSHTFRTDAIESLATQNGYTIKAYNLGIGGHVPLGIDAAVQSDEYRDHFSMLTSAPDEVNGDQDAHLPSFTKRKGATYLPQGTTWVILHDGSTLNSLTSAGAFMGLASVFGAKTACYQNWDTPTFASYAAHEFKMPLIPVGYAIPSEQGQPKASLVYHVEDGHMSNLGAYAFAVSFLHFFSNMPIDSIRGNAGFYDITEKEKETARTAVQMAFAQAATEKSATPYYFESSRGTKNTTISNTCTTLVCGIDYTQDVALGDAVVVKIPHATNGKLTITVTSSNDTVVPDIFFYNTKTKVFTAQLYNSKNEANLTYIGTGASWEHDNSCLLIVTRRGITRRIGSYDVKTNKFTIQTKDLSPTTSCIEETGITPQFTIQAKFKN